MYKHVVLWKLKDKANDLSKDELAIEVKGRLEALPSLISEIKEYEVAINIGVYGASFYDVCLVSVFENKDSFWAYTKYQEHDDALEYIRSILEDEQIVDSQTS